MKVGECFDMAAMMNQEVSIALMTRTSARQVFPLFRDDMDELVRWFAFDPDYSLENDYNTIISDSQTSYSRTFIVFFKGIPCGRIGLYDYDEASRSIYLYYWVSSQYRRQHIASHGISLALQYVREMDAAIARVCFDVNRENDVSLAMLRKIPGITEEPIDKKRIMLSVKLSS